MIFVWAAITATGLIIHMVGNFLWMRNTENRVKALEAYVQHIATLEQGRRYQ